MLTMYYHFEHVLCRRIDTDPGFVVYFQQLHFIELMSESTAKPPTRSSEKHHSTIVIDLRMHYEH